MHSENSVKALVKY